MLLVLIRLSVSELKRDIVIVLLCQLDCAC